MVLKDININTTKFCAYLNSASESVFSVFPLFVDVSSVGRFDDEHI
jgi:hypothetical protein